MGWCKCDEARAKVREEFPFDIGDIIEQNGHPDRLEITGYITDQERLFVRDSTGRLSNGNEFEIWTGEVTGLWRKIPTPGAGPKVESREP